MKMRQIGLTEDDENDDNHGGEKHGLDVNLAQGHMYGPKRGGAAEHGSPQTA